MVNCNLKPSPRTTNTTDKLYFEPADRLEDVLNICAISRSLLA